MNISTAFAPPFKLILPFFIIGIFVYFISVILLFNFNIESLNLLDNYLLSWVHLFLLGFVIMIIFGAMAQLIPVVLEVGHFSIDLYYIIYPLLIIGTILMVFGFSNYPVLLPFGGTVAFIAFTIFLIETFLTILKVKKINFVIISIIIANIFLLLGLIVGIILSLGYSGIADFDIFSLLKVHIYFVLFGYVGITIMGMSLVLLPMFWLSHNFSWIYVKISLALLSLGILCVSFATLFQNIYLEDIGFTLCLIALYLYFHQIFIIYKKRIRMEKDIYLKSMLFAYVCFIIALILGFIHMIIPNDTILLSISWIIFAGFISQIIIGHLYKIVPFLVWFEKFSPLVGKEKVPMLADMVHIRSANFQLLFTSIGILLISLALLTTTNIIFKSGISFLLIGSIFLAKDMLYMINFKGE